MNRITRTVLLCAVVSCLLCSCSRTKTVETIGQHRVTIETTHFALGSSSSRRSVQDTAGGLKILTYESGNCSIRLEGEELTVNGRKYTIPNKDDSIYVKNGLVEINGKRVKPAPE